MKEPSVWGGAGSKTKGFFKKQEATSSLHSGHRSARDPGKEKWPVIISWMVHQLFMVFNHLLDLF